MIYYFTIFSIMLCSFILKKTSLADEKRNRIFIGFSFLILVLVASLRSNDVGNDLKTYLSIYKASNNIPMLDLVLDSLDFRHFGSTAVYNGFYEIGYVLLNKIIITLVNSDFAFKLISSCLILWLYLNFFYKYSKCLTLSVILFITLGYYTQTFVIIRQSIALGFLLLSYDGIKQKKIVKFIIFTLLAALFHKSAIVFMLIYPIVNLTFTKKRLICSTLLIILIFIISRPILIYLINMFYPFYSNLIVFGEGLNYFLMLTSLTILGLVASKFRIITDDKDLLIIVTIGIIIQLFTVNFSLLNRLGLYFQFFLLIYLSNCLQSTKFKNYVTIIMVLCSLLYFQLITLERDAGGIADYQIGLKSSYESSSIDYF